MNPGGFAFEAQRVRVRVRIGIGTRSREQKIEKSARASRVPLGPLDMGFTPKKHPLKELARDQAPLASYGNADAPTCKLHILYYSSLSLSSVA
jgi:hypothetical protein